MTQSWKVRVTYRPDHKDFGDYMKHSPALQKAVLRVAQKISARAAATAPRDRGVYASSFSAKAGGIVEIMDTRVGKPNPRLSALVENTARNAAAVEFGSGSEGEGGGDGVRPQGGWNKPQRVLLKAGLRYGSARTNG